MNDNYEPCIQKWKEVCDDAMLHGITPHIQCRSETNVARMCEKATLECPMGPLVCAPDYSEFAIQKPKRDIEITLPQRETWQKMIAKYTFE